MPERDLVQQTKNAFDFVQKLYFEISYLIKEVEGLLQQEEEEFLIARPSGYGVTAKSSTGLEPINVENWISKTLTVCFIPASSTETKGGQTITPIEESLRTLFLHIDLLVWAARKFYHENNYRICFSLQKAIHYYTSKQPVFFHLQKHLQQ